MQLLFILSKEYLKYVMFWGFNMLPLSGN